MKLTVTCYKIYIFCKVCFVLGYLTIMFSEHVFQEHKRTVNRVCFHENEPRTLLSASQDGHIKLFVCYTCWHI